MVWDISKDFIELMDFILKGLGFEYPLVNSLLFLTQASVCGLQCLTQPAMCYPGYSGDLTQVAIGIYSDMEIRNKGYKHLTSNPV